MNQGDIELNKKTFKIIIIVSSIILVLGLYAVIMVGLLDFSDPANGIVINDLSDDGRDPAYQFVVNGTDADIGRALGHFLWETRAIDVILIGIILFVASESAATIVKGFEDQCSEFRQEMCDTDKFIILEEQKAEQEKEE